MHHGLSKRRAIEALTVASCYDTPPPSCGAPSPTPYSLPSWAPAPRAAPASSYSHTNPTANASIAYGQAVALGTSDISRPRWRGLVASHGRRNQGYFLVFPMYFSHYVSTWKNIGHGRRNRGLGYPTQSNIPAKRPILCPRSDLNKPRQTISMSILCWALEMP
jgi:hypothetical protein